MKIGVVYPQTEFPADPLAIRDYAQTVEELGFSHILAYDHVLGANPNRPGWKPAFPYTYQSSFMSPLLLFSFMAAVTQKLGFITGILILPQRETALVAKQAASLDVLCQGRLRLGVGIGWNEIEFTALNQDFHTRGRRIEEQVTLLRDLWTQPLVEFTGNWHHIPDAGLNPMPVQQPIPVWFGGHAPAVLRRVARMGDGWIPDYRRVADAHASLDTLSRLLEEAGRSWQQVGLETRLVYGQGNPDSWRTIVTEWQEAGATHMSFNTMRAGFNQLQDHLSALRRFAEEIDLQSHSMRA